MKTKALISFVVTAKLICAFGFAYADCWFSHDAAHLFSISAVIFVIDSSNKDRLQEAYNELAKLVQEKELKEASLLIFANKQVITWVQLSNCF